MRRALAALALTLPLGLSFADPAGLVLERWLSGPDPERQSEAWRVLREGTGAARQFHGLDGPPGPGPERLCSDLLRSLPRGRPARRWPWREVAAHLHEARPPSETHDGLWAAGSGARRDLERRLRACQRPVGPAELLALGVEAAGGDVGLGVLACHDLLKDLAFRGRAQQPARLAEGDGQLASRLTPWRRHPFSAAGGLDKIGPLYHLFAALAAGVLSGEPLLARAAVVGESTRRLVHQGRDRPDPEKALADRCGAQAALRLLGS